MNRIQQDNYRQGTSSGFILPIVLSIILIITLLASSSTDVLRLNYRMEQSKDQHHIAHQRALTSLSAAESYLVNLGIKPQATFEIKRDTLDPIAVALWDSELTNYRLVEEKDRITGQLLSHYTQNTSWWRSYGNPVAATAINHGKASGYMASETADTVGHFIIEDFAEVVEMTALSHNTDYHKRPSSTLYAISVNGEFNETANSTMQSYYIKNYY